jgi:hypothetical protein
MFEFPKMLPVFREEKYQTQFERDGYIVLPFYLADEIRELTDLYRRLHPRDETGFPIAAYFQDIKVICGSFIVKSPAPESAMCVHQDMTLVDESKYTGINIWVPLIDLNDENWKCWRAAIGFFRHTVAHLFLSFLRTALRTSSPI